MAVKYVSSSPTAASIAFDNSSNGFLAENIQDAILEAQAGDLIIQGDDFYENALFIKKEETAFAYKTTGINVHIVKEFKVFSFYKELKVELNSLLGIKEGATVEVLNVFG